MSLSKGHLDKNPDPVPLDIPSLAKRLEEIPDIEFAYVLGSSVDGVVPANSDLDIAVYLSGTMSLDLYERIEVAVGTVVPGVRCDVGVLNRAEPVYAYEALKGRRLFARDHETWISFYSKTCRLLENQMFHYEKQRRYRLESSSDGQARAQP